jgi:hypothetical protein
VWPCRNDSHLIDLPARQHPAAPGPKPAARDAHVSATSNYITAVRKVHHLMEPKTYRPSVLKRRASATLAAAAASAALIAALIAPAASSAKVTAHPASGTPLIFESSPEVGFTPANYNPYVQSTPAYQAGGLQPRQSFG